jgi:hypothetical protein
VYQIPWVNLYVDKVRFPDGRIINRHHLLDFECPSVVVVIENERDQILLVRVNRYTTGLTQWEMPAGSVDHWRIYEYYPLNGITTSLCTCCGVEPESASAR